VPADCPDATIAVPGPWDAKKRAPPKVSVGADQAGASKAQDSAQALTARGPLRAPQVRPQPASLYTESTKVVRKRTAQTTMQFHTASRGNDEWPPPTLIVKGTRIMNTKQLIVISAAAFAMLGAVGAVHAETYEGVHSITSYASRADIRAEAVGAAHNDSPYAEGANSGPAPVIASSTNRAAVRAEAVAAAHSDNPYAEGASSGVAPILGGTVNRATVRATAHGDALPL